MSSRNPYVIHVKNVETAEYNLSPLKKIPTTPKFNIMKRAVSREFDAYERYYGINNSQDYEKRKQNYIIDDNIFKHNLKCKPKTKSKPKKIITKLASRYHMMERTLECYTNCCYTLKSEPRKSARPMNNMEIELDDKKPIDDVDPNNMPMDWNNYHRLAVIHKFMDDLEFDYPSLCTTGTIGRSLEGRDLKILKISNSDSTNECVWIDAGIHAREWIAPAVNTYVADHIARNFDSMPNSVRNKDWYFMPVLNPDGYEYSHTTNRMWRKNKAYIRNQLYGVDLNRNFSLAWGGLGSSSEPKHAFYRGPAPFSEPESSAIRDIFLHSGIRFKVYLTLHSYGQVIIMPFAHRKELAEDYIRLLEGATVMSKAIYDTNGNTYKVGISKDVMYQASGTSNDWSHGAVGIPYCYLIELRSKKHKFKLPKEEIAETGEEILNCIIALMEFIDNYKAPAIEKKHLTPKSEEISEILKTETLKNREEIKIENTEEPVEKLKLLKTGFFAATDSDADEVAEQRETQVSVEGFEEIYEEIDTSVKVAPLNSITQVWEVRLTREGQRNFVKSLDTLGALNIWSEENNTMDIMVEGPRAAQVAGMLHERDVPFSIAMPDVNSLYQKEVSDRMNIITKRSSSRKAESVLPYTHAIIDVTEIKMDWNNYHRLETIYDFMDNLVAEYPYLCQVSIIGRTAEGRDIKLLKVSNGDEGNEGVWLDGAIHAREWISPAVVTYIADQIVRNFHTYPSSVTSKDWFIVPVLNPDGYEYSHTADRMWRKNRARYGECIGVDLNRNWSHGWGEKGEEGSSDDPGNIFFRGPKPFSEAETNAVKHTILESTTTFKVFLSLHSYGEAIIFPWGCASEPCPDYVMLLEGGAAIAKAIHQTSGRTYKVGSTKDLMYYACGNSTDWSYAVAKILFSYMIELRGKQHRFLLPKDEIVSTAKEVLNGVLRLLDFANGKCKSTPTCVCPN